MAGYRDLFDLVFYSMATIYHSLELYDLNFYGLEDRMERELSRESFNTVFFIIATIYYFTRFCEILDQGRQRRGITPHEDLQQEGPRPLIVARRRLREGS